MDKKADMEFFMNGLDKEAFLMGLAAKAATKMGKGLIGYATKHPAQAALGGAMGAMGGHGLPGAALGALTPFPLQMAKGFVEGVNDDYKVMKANSVNQMTPNKLQSL